MEPLPLPPPTAANELTVEAAVAARRSCRRFTDESITAEQLSRLLWAAQGITGPDGQRTVPSAGGQYPLRVLVAIGAVSHAPPSLYRYQPEEHSLVPVTEGDHRPALERSAIDDQPWIGQAAVVLTVVADMTGITEHFRDQAPRGERGRRYALIETGAVAQNVHLEAEALGLGCVVVAGFDDGAVSTALDLVAGHVPTTMLVVGHPDGRRHAGA